MAAKPNQPAAAEPPKVDAPAAAKPEPAKVDAPAAGGTNKVDGVEKKEMTAKEKLEAGVNGIIAGNGGLKEGQLIGEAVGEGIKNLFGQGKKEGPAAPAPEAPPDTAGLFAAVEAADGD